MVTLLVTLGDANPPMTQTTPISTFNLAFHRDFKFDMQVDHSRSQPMDDKLSVKWAWS